MRHGCPLFPYLFILGAEVHGVLASKIKEAPSLDKVKLVGTEHKVSQFADDTSLFLRNFNSVENSPKLIDEFGYISGLKLNVKKTKAIWFGPQRFTKSKPFGKKWTKGPVRALETLISYGQKENTKKNVELEIESMTIKLSNLSLLGLYLVNASSLIVCLSDCLSTCLTVSLVVSQRSVAR